MEVSTVLRRGSLAVETSRSVGCSVSSKLSVGLLREAWDALCLPGFSLQCLDLVALCLPEECVDLVALCLPEE